MLTEQEVPAYLRKHCRWQIVEQVRGVYESVPVGPVRCYGKKDGRFYCGMTVWRDGQLYWAAVYVTEDGVISVSYFKLLEYGTEWEWLN